jgi:hypothetical protein
MAAPTQKISVILFSNNNDLSTTMKPCSTLTVVKAESVMKNRLAAMSHSAFHTVSLTRALIDRTISFDRALTLPLAGHIGQRCEQVRLGNVR